MVAILSTDPRRPNVRGMARIIVTQRLVEGADDQLRSSGHEVVFRSEPGPMPHAELVDAAASADAIVCLLSDRIDAAVLGASPNLKVVGNVAVGIDNIDLAAAGSARVAIVNTPGVLDGATADIALLLMLSVRRRASEAEARLRAGRWTGWSLGDHLGRDLSGSTIGLVGFGGIGRAVGRRLHGFDVKLLHHTRHDTGEEGYVATLEDLASCSDVLSVHVPFSEDTRHLIDAEILALMAPTSVLINTARGPVVDEAALADALESGRLAGAGLDVFDGEPSVNPRLLAAPGCTLLPHIGSATVEVRRAMCDLAISGVLEVLAGGQPKNLVKTRSDPDFAEERL